MYNSLFPSFASLLFALSLCNNVSNSYFLTSWLTSALLLESTVATSTETTLSASLRYRTFKAPQIGVDTLRNVSTAFLCSGASGYQTPSNCRPTVLPTGSGGTNVHLTNSTRIASKHSPATDASVSEWQGSLRSKPGTFSVGSLKLSTANIIHRTEVSGPYAVSTRESSLLTSRYTNAKNTVVIYETSTKCTVPPNSSLPSSGLDFRTSISGFFQLASTTVKSEPETSKNRPQVSSRTTAVSSSASVKHALTANGTKYDDRTMSEGLPQKDSSPMKDNSTYRTIGRTSLVTVSNSSSKPSSANLPSISSSFQVSSLPNRTQTALRISAFMSSSAKRQLISSTSNLPSVSIIRLNRSSSPSAPSETLSKLNASLASSDVTFTGTRSIARSEVYTLKLSVSRVNGSTSPTISASSLMTKTDTTTSSSSQITSTLLSTLKIHASSTNTMTSSSFRVTPIMLSTLQINSSHTNGSEYSQSSSKSSLAPSSKLAANASKSLAACAVASRTQPATTSWMAGACKLTSFDDPASTLKCASSIITPLPVTACACPDGQFYERMAGGDGPCNEYTSIAASEFLEPILTCTDLPTNCIPVSTSSTPISTPPPVPYGGHFSAIPSYPSTCNATTITYSSTMPLRTGQIMIDSSIGWGNANSKWIFQAGGGVTIDRMNNTSNPGTSKFSGNWEPSSENFTRNADGSWTMTVVPDMPSLSLIAITSGGQKNKTFPLTVISVIPCDKPVALQCNNSFSDLTQSQWVAFEVDQFVTMIEAEFQATKGPNFFEWFLNEYIGDTLKAPCQIDQEGCQPLSAPCTFVKPGPYERQAFFVLNGMITLSRYIRYAWLAYERTRGDLLSELAAWTTAFIVPERTQTWQNIVAITASVFGILSVIGFAAAPFMPEAAAIFTPLLVGAISSGMFGVNSLLNTAINAANANGAAVAAEIQFDGYAKADQAMNAYINASEQALIDTNNAYFLHGTNLSQVLQGGVFVAKTPIAELTDGDFSGAVVAAADWFDKTMIWSLINQAWKSDDNYIVFLPYGPVKWYSGDTREFTAQMCHDQFLSNGHWNGTIYGSCDAGPPDHPGFATFMTAQKLMDFNEYNSKSYYEVSYSYQNYNFDADDVFKSSIAGYYQSGYNFNATSVPVGQLLTEQNQQPIAQYINQTATSPGIFNVPVCIISDTSYVPACTITDWGNRGDPCYTSPKQCLESKWIDPKDPTRVQNFTSFVSQNVVSGLQDATTYDNLWKD